MRRFGHTLKGHTPQYTQVFRRGMRIYAIAAVLFSGVIEYDLHAAMYEENSMISYKVLNPQHEPLQWEEWQFNSLSWIIALFIMLTKSWNYRLSSLSAIWNDTRTWSNSGSKQFNRYNQIRIWKHYSWKLQKMDIKMCTYAKQYCIIVLTL